MRPTETVAIGWADPGVVDGVFAVSLMMLSVARQDRLGPVVRVEGACLISKLRNQIVSTFLDQSDADWLLMLDSDEELTASTFDLLVDAADADKRPIMAGLYFGAFQTTGLYPDPVPMIFRQRDSGFQPVASYPRDRVIPVDAAGTGCLLIHRRVLQDMREHATADEGKDWCWFVDGPVNGQWVGEDIAFCMRAKLRGYPIHAHTGAVLAHRKRYWLTRDHHLAHREN